MQNATCKTDDLPPAPPRRQFSLQSALIAVTVACISLAVGRIVWPLLPPAGQLVDIRLIPLAVVIALLTITGGRTTRGVAIGGILGLCLGCARFDEARWPLSDQVLTLLATGAFGAWLGGALHAGKIGYDRTALIAILGLFGWFTLWLR